MDSEQMQDYRLNKIEDSLISLNNSVNDLSKTMVHFVNVNERLDKIENDLLELKLEGSKKWKKITWEVIKYILLFCLGLIFVGGK